MRGPENRSRGSNLWGVLKYAEGFQYQERGEVKKSRLLSACYRRTIRAGIAPVCIGEEERSTGKLEVVDRDCCKLDRTIWGFWRESARIVESKE